MRRFALAAVLSLAACAHGTSAAPKPEGTANLVRHAVPPIVAEGVEGSAVPQVFEQTFCSALFEANDKQVVCADDMRAFMRIQQEKALMGVQGMSAEDAQKAMDAPRTVVLRASKAGEKIAVSVAVQTDKGETLIRFSEELAADGGDLGEKARDAALRVAYLPK